MNLRRFFGLVITIAILGVIFIFFFASRQFPSIKNNTTLSLLTEPDDGITPVLAMIRGAAKSVDLVMYELDDKQIDAALAADEARGVAVRVILSAGYNGAFSTENVAAYNALRAAGVPVRWSPTYFSLTHEKSLVVDGARALIMTFNLTAQYYSTSRDFGVVDDDANDVGAMERTFDDDWEGIGVSADGNNGARADDLLWSPGSEKAMVNLINSARSSLLVYNEEMADMTIVKALIDAAQRGVQVDVDMTDSLEWKWQFTELTTAGVHVRTYADTSAAPLYIHAKMVLVDDARAFLGSENFSFTSLNDNRELGIVVSDPAIITSLARTFSADWRGATPFSS